MQTKINTSRNKMVALAVGGVLLAVGSIFCVCVVLMLAGESAGQDEPARAAAKAPASEDMQVDHQPVSQLSFFEQELVGIWKISYRSSGDKGYVRFNDNRTACKWEEKNGSSSRSNYSHFVHWKLEENQPIQKDRFRVIMTWANGNQNEFTFDYPRNQIWPEDYSTHLIYSRSSSDKTCN